MTNSSTLRPMMTYQALDAIAYASRLHQAGLDHELQSYISQLSGEGIDEIKPWLGQLSLRASEYSLNDLPDSVYQRCEGWRNYFLGRYIDAYVRFQASISHQDWQAHAYDAALGMAKIYTRSGHWQLAQEWALYYLSVARTMRDDFGLTKGYGALAEIYLRGNQPQAALACFQIANQVMPLGQGQLDKQYNFIASALIRNDEWLRAETLLRNSIKMSSDKLNINPDDLSAKISYLHSFSRLSYLNLARKQPLQLPKEIEGFTSKLINNSLPSALCVPLGFILSARAIESIHKDQTKSAQSDLALALSAFEPVAPMESQWVLRLCKGLSGKLESGFTTHLPYQQLIDIQPIAAPIIDVVVDKTWAEIRLNNDGYQPLIASQDSITALTQMWRLFFV